jgi:hypothetical protein
MVCLHNKYGFSVSDASLIINTPLCIQLLLIVLSSSPFLCGSFSMGSSSKILAGTESSAASTVFPFEDEVFIFRSQVDQFNSRVPHDPDSAIAGFRLLLETYKQSLAQRSDQVAKLMANIEVKCHQLSLKDR